MSVNAAVGPTPVESGPGTPPGTEGPKGVVPLVRRFGPSILINGVAPYFIYFVLRHQFQVAELPALVATSIPPLLDVLVGIVRWRRDLSLRGSEGTARNARQRALGGCRREPSDSGACARLA